MCGIAGFFRFDSRPQPSDERHLLAVRDHMTPRGPDSAGLWLSPDRRVGLANRRLAIQDLSEAGNQPMFSADGNLVVVFNGEIYNYPELRKELESQGVVFRSHCDTEILLHLYKSEGTSFPYRLRGMFAFAIFDKVQRQLFIARDHFGQKPLYYSEQSGAIWFASQVKSLLRNTDIPRTPDPAGHTGFFLWGHVPSPFTLYDQIKELRSGSAFLIQYEVGRQELEYFSIDSEVGNLPSIGVRSRDEAQEVLGEALGNSVKAHLLSDLPVGVFLSAGIDSTAITGLAAQDTSHQLRTLTLGFREFIGTGSDETVQARKNANAFQLPHSVSWISRKDFFDDLKSFFAAMDQPTVDAINVYLVSRAASRQGLKVAISGLGGDELFGSYPSFTQVPKTVRFLAPFRHSPFVGRTIRRVLAPFRRWFSSPKWVSLIEMGTSMIHAYFLRRGLFMHWELGSVLDPEMVSQGLRRLHQHELAREREATIRDPFLQVMTLEMKRYMHNQLLRDSDWAGMAFTVEIRMPMVDVPLFRTIVGLHKGNASRQKSDLGKLVSKSLSRSFLTRPKSGFMIPVTEWIIAGTKYASIGSGLRNWSGYVYREYGKQ